MIGITSVGLKSINIRENAKGAGRSFFFLTLT